MMISSFQSIQHLITISYVIKEFRKFDPLLLQFPEHAVNPFEAIPFQGPINYPTPPPHHLAIRFLPTRDRNSKQNVPSDMFTHLVALMGQSGTVTRYMALITPLHPLLQTRDVINLVWSRGKNFARKSDKKNMSQFLKQIMLSNSRLKCLFLY